MTETAATTTSIPVHCAHDKMVVLAELKPHPKNTNRHPEGQIILLARIIAAHGWRAPITVSERSGYIVRGEGRYRAALRLGVTEAPVDYQAYETEAQELEDLVADNRIAELALQDEAALAALLQATPGVNVELAGFTQQEYAALLGSVSGDMTFAGKTGRGLSEGTGFAEGEQFTDGVTIQMRLTQTEWETIREAFSQWCKDRNVGYKISSGR